ncbi:MAG: hypothetical protein ACI85G_001465 [Psychroserpens sp.]|jgi:hypothetical protein
MGFAHEHVITETKIPRLFLLKERSPHWKAGYWLTEQLRGDKEVLLIDFIWN